MHTGEASLLLDARDPNHRLPRLVPPDFGLDAGKDLNAYALVEGQGGCCSPAMKAATGLPLVESPCAPSKETETVHGGLADLVQRHDLNDYAASVQVYALKT